MLKLFSKAKRAGKKQPFCSVVVVAAGRSERFGQDKMRVSLGGIPVIVHTLLALDACPEVSEVVLVTRSDSLVDMARLCKEFRIGKVTKVILGGETRSQSALAGVYETNPKAELIGIHDGARPLITREIIAAAIAAAGEHLAAAPAVDISDTIKTVSEGKVVRTLDRGAVMAVQTPQVFEADLIKAALSNAVMNSLNITDDCAAVEVFGVRPWLTAGSYENIKITTAVDLLTAEAVLGGRSGG